MVWFVLVGVSFRLYIYLVCKYYYFLYECYRGGKDVFGGFVFEVISKIAIIGKLLEVEIIGVE